MASDNPWDDAYREIMERGRARFEPPTAEELLAWSRGEVKGDEAELMRERLAWYPELAASLSDYEPADDEAPLLSREQIAADLELIQQRVDESLPHPATVTGGRSWSQWSTIVPTIATVLFAGLFVQSLFTIDELRKENAQPREGVERAEIHSLVGRGDPISARPIVLQPSTKYVVLVLHVSEDVRAESARIEIRDLENNSAIVWKSAVTRGGDGTFSIEIPRTFLTSRSYEIKLFADATEIAKYTIWISGSLR